MTGTATVASWYIGSSKKQIGPMAKTHFQEVETDISSEVEVVYSVVGATVTASILVVGVSVSVL